MRVVWSGLVLALPLSAVLLSGAPARGDAQGSPAACPRVSYRATPAPRSPEAVATEAFEGRLQRPPNPAGPTLVDIGIYVVELTEIDVIRGSFQFLGYVEAEWCDPRLGFEPAGPGASEKLFVGPEAQAAMGRMWRPDILLSNEIESVQLGKLTLTIAPDGTVRLRALFNARLAAEYDLRRFPFDDQILPIHIESFTWNSQQVRFSARDTAIGFAASVAIPEWHISQVRHRLEDARHIRDGKPFARLAVEVQITRDYGFYLTKLAGPLLLIVALSWSVFWMRDEPLAGRIRISATSVLTIVAYQFAIARDLPKVAYLTALDEVMILSFVLISLTALESMLMDHTRSRDEALALRIDRTCRWLFPLGYAFALATLAAIYTR